MAKKKKKAKSPLRIGVVDTMFARFDMGAAAPGANSPSARVTARISRSSARPCRALKISPSRRRTSSSATTPPSWWPSVCRAAPIDKQCAHEASIGIMQAQLMTSTPILEVFVHEDESDDPMVLAKVFLNRSRSHARNAYWMLFEPEELAKRAGQGMRQGFTNAGPLEGN